MTNRARAPGGDRSSSDPLATATHARLRAAQGDLDGARRILASRLARHPEDREARALLRALSARGSADRLRFWLGRLRGFGALGGTMLDETLEGVWRAIDGARAVLLVGQDGVIAAACPGGDDEPSQWIAAGYADLLRRAGEAHREAGLGEPDELVIETADATVVLQRVSPEYALLALVEAGAGPVGRARYELRKAASAVRPEVAG